MIDSLFLLVELVCLIVFLIFLRRGLKQPESEDIGIFSYQKNDLMPAALPEKKRK